MTTDERFPHLFMTGRAISEPYVYAGPIPRGPVRLPARDCATHGTTLREEMDRARQENELLRGVTTAPEAPARIILEVESEPDFELALDSLEARGQGVELACVREDNGVRTAVIHVPEEKLGYFVKRVEQYLGEQTARGQPKNQNLFDRIAVIRLASLRSFWTDEGADFPAEGQAIWWETWLRAEGDQDPWVTFQMIAEAAGLRLGRETIRFPDRLVVLCFGTAAELSSTVDLLDLLGEVRRAKENPAEFVEMSPREQGEWVNHLRGRLVPPGHDAPAVCILDGGVVLHPLVRPALSPEDAVKYDPTWPLTDGLSHGTEMAGIAIYGDQLPPIAPGRRPGPPAASARIRQDPALATS